MHLTTIDVILICAFIALSLGINFYYRRQAGRSLDDFFLGGRKLPWYLAGISMVATTFAADTPLAVTEIVAEHGIAGNWLWWNALAGGMLTVFFFARLWHRSGVLTEAELIELRYAGKPAAFLRGFKAVYLGLFMNVMIIGWVNLAMISLFQVFFGITPMQAFWFTAAAMAFVAFYSSIAGLKGIAVTDFLQFFVAMAGCVVLAVMVVSSDQIGGIAGLKAKLAYTNALSFLPQIGSGKTLAMVAFSLPAGTFLAFMTTQWWASWYPGAEPGGGGYVAQRIMSARSEREAVWATLLFQITHYCLRPWPWILVGLSALILYPDLSQGDKRLGFAMAMRDFLPAGARGLLLIAFLGAYMSTISTQLNWGAGYLVNDLYKRFVRPTAGQRHWVQISRLTTLALMVVSLFVTLQLTSIKAVWEFILQCGAGLGLVLILRWFWWRINAWSEISATIAPFAAYGVLKFSGWGRQLEAAWGWGTSFMAVVAFTTLVWLLVTFITQPTDSSHLERFYRRVEPGGWWQPVRLRLGLDLVRGDLAPLLICWLSSILMTYSLLFLIGKLVLAEWEWVSVYSGLALAAFLVLRRAMDAAGPQLGSTIRGQETRPAQASRP